MIVRDLNEHTKRENEIIGPPRVLNIMICVMYDDSACLLPPAFACCFSVRVSALPAAVQSLAAFV